MAELQLIDYGRVRPLSLTDAIAEWQQIDANKQQQKLNEMKMAEAEFNAPLERRMSEARTQDYTAQAELNQQKAHMQRVQFANNIAKQAFAYADKTGLKQGTPEYDQAVRQAAEPFRGAMSQAFGHADTGEPIDINALRSLASMDVTGGAEYHPPVTHAGGIAEWTPQGWRNVEINGQQLKPGQYDVGTQYNIGKARAIANLVQQGHITPQQAEMLLGEQQKVPTANWTPEHEQDLIARANKGDQSAINEIENTAKGVTNHIPSFAERHKTEADIKTEASLAETEGKNELEMQKAKQERIKSVNEMLDLIKNFVGENGQTIEDLIKKSTGSYLGKARDIAAATIGQSTEGANALADLKPIHEWLTSLVPRMQGPQSNFDVARYQAMAGDIANPDIPAERRIISFKSLIKMLESYQKSGGEKQSTAKSDLDIYSEADAILRGGK